MFTIMILVVPSGKECTDWIEIKPMALFKVNFVVCSVFMLFVGLWCIHLSHAGWAWSEWHLTLFFFQVLQRRLLTQVIYPLMQYSQLIHSTHTATYLNQILSPGLLVPFMLRSLTSFTTVVVSPCILPWAS